MRFGGHRRRKVRIINSVQTLQVDVGHSRYPIAIGSGLLTNRELLDSHIRGRDLMIVTNATVARLYLAKLTGGLAPRRVAECILPDGEQHKTLQTAGWVFDALVGQKMNRDATVLALGGGVVGDIAGFAAASYQRGDRLRAAADDAAGASRLFGRRQDRGQSFGRQELDRRVLSAALRHRGHRYARHSAGPGAAAPGSPK